MTAPNNDIDALQAQLMKAREDEGWFITGDQGKDFSRALTALVAERDALRREVCQLVSSNRFVYDSPQQIASERGWDCFKDGGGA